MSVRLTFFAVVTTVLVAFGCNGMAAEGAKTPKTIDLHTTGVLVKQWGSRPSFPESVTFAYYHVYMADALGLKVEPKTRQRMIDYIAECQQPDGGFTSEPRHATTSNVIYTFYALQALDLLGGMEAIDRKAAIGFLRARKAEGGGMVATPRSGEHATLATTYYGVEALRLLDAIDPAESVDTVALIGRFRVEGQGFARVEGGSSNPRSTYMGVRALKTLGALSDQAGKEVIAYLKGTRYSGLVTERRYRTLPSVDEMAATLETLVLLSALPQVNREGMQAFVESLYVPVNGGFGPRPRLGTTPPSTYQAVRSLVRLGRLPDPLARKGGVGKDV